MTKQTLRGLAAAFAVLAAGYLFGAFVALDWDVAHWTVTGRSVLSFVALLLAITAFMGTIYDR